MGTELSSKSSLGIEVSLKKKPRILRVMGLSGG